MKSKRAIVVAILTIGVTILLLPNLIQKTNADNRSQAAKSSVISFPKDHAFHPNFKREWWYINLMIRLSSNNNQNLKDIGYIISFSRINNISGLLTSRYDQSNNSFSQKTNQPGTIDAIVNKSGLLTVSFSQKNGPALTLTELSSLKNGAKRYSLNGSTPEIGTLNLTLTERTVNSKGSNTPLLWGCNGNISVFSPDDTFYYSIPDLDITGSVKDTDGISRKVAVGKAWMDHQWFNSSPPADWQGHYWSNLYLTTRSDFEGPHIAISAVTQIYKNKPKYSYWVKRNLDGSNECGTDLKFQTEFQYGNKYPSKISLTIVDDSKRTIYSGKILPFSSSQTFDVAGNSFFEPMSYTYGSAGKINYTGLGFFETGLKK